MNESSTKNLPSTNTTANLSSGFPHRQFAPSSKGNPCSVCEDTSGEMPVTPRGELFSVCLEQGGI
ncbi:MAG: hypothetical protein HC916_19830 [Coleofasciculaceae cyanobacterium SM2_1_6]|nr:hypothetical protein [Coleofasciculaceae cyanobacterium SM2_1_6]